MAKQTLGPPPTASDQPAAPDFRRRAGRSLAASASGLLGCDACEVWAFDGAANAYSSIGASGERTPLVTKASVPAGPLIDAFPEGIDVLTVDKVRTLDEPMHGMASSLAAASALFLRAKMDGRELGLIVCGYSLERELSAADSITPKSFARLAATVLNLAHRVESALDRADHMAALVDSASRFAGELDLESLFGAIHEEVARHMNAPSFYVALESGDAKELRTEYAIEAGTRFHSDVLPGREGLAAQVYRSSHPALVEWSDAHAGHNGENPALGGSLVMVPMRLGNRVIGVMAAQSKSANAYTQHHVEFLLEVAEQAATAIQNAGMLREERRRTAELTMLHRVAVVTSSETQLDRIMAAVVVEAASIFHADAASIALENERGEFELAATFGLSENYRKQRRLSATWLRTFYGDPPKERFVGPDRIQSMGQPDLIGAEGVTNVFLIPFVYRGRLVGSLALHGRRSIVRLSAGEARLAQVFADQVAAALHRAQGAQHLAERIEDYDLIAKVGRALASSLPVDFSTVLDILHRQLGYSHLTIFSVDGTPPQLNARATAGHVETRAPSAVDRGLVGLVASTGEMAYVPNVAMDARYVSAAPEVQSLIAYPLKVENNVVGVLCIESPKLDGFSGRDRRLLGAIADQTAVAMSNSRLYATATERLSTLTVARAQSDEYARYLERRQEELKLLSAVGSAVNSSLNLSRMLASAANNIAHGLHVQRCTISLYNEGQTHIEVAADVWNAGAPPLVGARFPIRADSPVLRMLREHVTVSSEDAACDARFDAGRQEILELQLRGLAMVPIASEGQLLGTLVVGQTSEPRLFVQEQLGALETVATQLALGIRNARLYGRARERANEDSLTGLFNHRYLQGRLDQELARSQRSSQPLAIALFDLNNFKAFNDNYGHQAGDEVLRFMATALHQSLRATDVAGRYGGDEFLVILPQSDEQGARLLLERVRRKLDEETGSGLLPIPIRLSAGIAVYPRDADNKTDLIARADAAMYADKRKP